MNRLEVVGASGVGGLAAWAASAAALPPVAVGIAVGVGVGLTFEYLVKPGVSFVFQLFGASDPYQRIRQLEPLGSN